MCGERRLYKKWPVIQVEEIAKDQGDPKSNESWFSWAESHENDKILQTVRDVAQEKTCSTNGKVSETYKIVQSTWETEQQL